MLKQNVLNVDLISDFLTDCTVSMRVFPTYFTREFFVTVAQIFKLFAWKEESVWCRENVCSHQGRA